MKLLCRSCGAGLTVEDRLRTTTCPYCESPQVVERPPDPSRVDPAFVVGFSVGHEQAHQRVRRWLKGRTLFARSGVHQASLDEVRGVYAPAYLYSAVARARYEAQIGEAYYETVVRGSGKNRRVERVRRTEWWPLSGAFAAYVSEVVVTASRGLDNQALERVEPFDLRQLRRYHPALLSGWIAEDASRAPEECLGLAQGEAKEEVGRRLRGHLPGDELRQLSHQTSLEAESLDLALVPVWIFTARYAPDRPPMRILVNGQTGKTDGRIPLSWVKILLAVLLALALATGAALLLGAGQGR